MLYGNFCCLYPYESFCLLAWTPAGVVGMTYADCWQSGTAPYAAPCEVGEGFEYSSFC